MGKLDWDTMKHKYKGDEVLSALQKDIRRGNEMDAMHWALEFGYGTKAHFGLLRNRLKIIAYEDIGIANPDVVLQVSKAVDDMDYLYQNNNEDWEMVLAHIILLLCRSEKSRIDDYFKVVMKDRWDKNKWEIPDYALDYHTVRGSKKGRRKHTKKGIEHFINEGEKLENVKKVNLDDIYKKEAHKVWKG